MNLQGVQIPHSNLQGANLFGGAHLRGTSLRGAVPGFADLRGADLTDVSVGQHLSTLEGHSGRVHSVALSPNGLLIVSGAVMRRSGKPA